MASLHFERILAPTDFSSCAEKAFRFAAGLARTFDSEIVLLHVFDERVVSSLFNLRKMAPEEAREAMLKTAKKRMKKLMKVDFAKDLRLRARYEQGFPPRVVQATAEEIGADLIVMGQHGDAGLAQLLYGSTAEGVVRGAPCPVLTINP
ncbi:MAG: universal stress protein [Planctomycetota bacterium]